MLGENRRRTRDELEESLRKHLGFIWRSCEWFDVGEEAEAERIAVSLRVLFHTSRALLRQLGMAGMELPSTQNHTDEPTPWIRPIELALEPFRAKAVLDNADLTTLVALDEWWRGDQFLSSPDYPVTRETQVLSLANRDGAHIDPRLSWLDRDLRTLYEFELSIERTGDGEAITRRYRFENALHASVRQIAHEVLLAPELDPFLP